MGLQVKGKWSIPSFTLYALIYPIISQFFKAVQKSAHFNYWFWIEKTNKKYEKNTKWVNDYLYNDLMECLLNLFFSWRKSWKRKKVTKQKWNQVPSSNCSHKFIYQKIIELHTIAGKISVFKIYSLRWLQYEKILSHTSRHWIIQVQNYFIFFGTQGLSSTTLSN